MFKANDQDVLCALGEIVFSRSQSHNNIQTVSNFYGVYSEMVSSEKSIFGNFADGNTWKKRSREGKDLASMSSP